MKKMKLIVHHDKSEPEYRNPSNIEIFVGNQHIGSWTLLTGPDLDLIVDLAFALGHDEVDVDYKFKK